MELTLSPAYGRDYKSKAAVQAAMDEGKDFIIETFQHPGCGQYVNRPQLKEEGHKTVWVRYKKLTQKAQVLVR